MVTNEIGPEVEMVLTEASRASVWIPWYFKQGTLTAITAPLFLILVYSVADSAFRAVIQVLALARATHAVFGFALAFLITSFAWVPAICPPILYYSIIKGLPGLWLRPDASRRVRIFYSLVVLVVFSLAAELIGRGIGRGVGWIADRDPCAAFAAGVTGAKLPINCH